MLGLLWPSVLPLWAIYNPELQCCVASYIQLIVICCGEQNSRFLCDKNAGKIKVKALKIVFSKC